jgi:hypothetical protein
MALVTETGSGSATAESYITVAAATTYHSDRGNTAWASLSNAVMEQSLRKSTEYMIQIYRMRWKGVRMLSTQALDWPRAWVYLEPVVTGASTEFPNLVADDIVPVPVQRACAELALKSSTATLLADVTQQKSSVTVGPISTTYDKYSPQAKRYSSIDAMLAPYLDTGAGVLKVVRA